MDQVTESEKEALRQAAEAVAPLLAKLRQERTELDERIAHLQAVIIAYEVTCGPRKAMVSGGAEKLKRGHRLQRTLKRFFWGRDYAELDLRKMIANVDLEKERRQHSKADYYVHPG